jgi:hypothetical protein
MFIEAVALASEVNKLIFAGKNNNIFDAISILKKNLDL